jgi:tetratricopeptide (TPR) repeat protein
MKTHRMLWAAVLFMLMPVSAGCSGLEVKNPEFFKRGQGFFEQRDFVKARLEFKNAMQLDPKFAEASYMLGMTELQMGNPRQAYANLNRAAELAPDLLKAQIQMGWLLFAGQEVDCAMEKADLVLAREPDNSEALMLRGSVFLARKDAESARTLLEGILKTKGSLPDKGYFLLSAAYREKKDLQKAERILQAGVESNQRSVLLHEALARAYASNKALERAIPHLQKMIDLEPENPRHKESLAFVYREAGREKEAVQLLDNMVSAEPKNEENWLRLARFHMAIHKLQEAESKLLSGIRQNPKSFKLRFALSEVYVVSKRFGDSVSILKECLGLEAAASHPSILQTKSLLAGVCLMMWDIEMAERYAREMVRED